MGVFYHGEEYNFDKLLDRCEWSFLENNIFVQGELWSIIVDDACPCIPRKGQSTTKLSHDFVHLDFENSAPIFHNVELMDLDGAPLFSVQELYS